jgi:hypothetical protein
MISSSTKSIEDTVYYGALHGRILTMDPLTQQRTALSLVDAVDKEEEATTVLLLDDELCDMVAVSTPHTPCAAIDSARASCVCTKGLL